MSAILVPVSAGELLDKITILRIKQRRITDADKLVNVRVELHALEQVWRSTAKVEIEELEAQLTSINETLWEVEDEIRDQERRQDFGDRFIELARQVYFANDRRASLKRDVNLKLGSALVEEKSYRPYAAAGITVTAGL